MSSGEPWGMSLKDVTIEIMPESGPDCQGISTCYWQSLEMNNSAVVVEGISSSGGILIDTSEGADLSNVRILAPGTALISYSGRITARIEPQSLSGKAHDPAKQRGASSQA
jgi:hypothetical protein